MNHTLQLANELAPLAREMRERQEQIETNKADVYEHISELIGLAAEQGKSCVLVKAKLGKHIRWQDWLGAHVPNLPVEDATKFERIAHEQLTDPRQCIFAFLPPPEGNGEHKPERSKPSYFEVVLSATHKLEALAKTNPPEQWPADQKEAARKRLAVIVKALWPALDV